MKLRRCLSCGKYGLKSECACGGKTKDAHYKFVKIKSVSELKSK